MPGDPWAGLHRQCELLAQRASPRYAQDNGITEPPGGLQISTGIPWPIIVVIAVTLVMTFVANRRRFGRYVYAYGGNPDAAELAGINTRWTLMKIYMLMGLLCGIAAAIAAARLNGATLDIGQSDELYVIAAAVVGGTSFAGGIGTIPGAVLGAVVMQTLAYGLAFVGANSPTQNIVAGVVLVVAVGFDTINRRRGVMSGMEDRPWPSRSERQSSRCGTSTSRSVACMPSVSVSIDLYPGEVVGLVGGNGAGKSTLMRVLSGAHPADSGEIRVDGKPVSIRTRVMPRPRTSRPSTRRWPWPTTSTRPGTCSSAAR